MGSIHYKGADIIIAVFDLTDKRTFENLLLDWLEEVSIYCNQKNTILLILGNKCDSEGIFANEREIKERLNLG